MQVDLKRHFQAGNAVLYRALPGGGLTDIPDQFRDHLPKDAVVVDDPQTYGQDEAKPVTVDLNAKSELHALDPLRAAGESEDELLKAAGLSGAADATSEAAKAKAEQFQKDLAAEKSEPKFTLKARGGGYFDVISAETHDVLNSKALRKEAAEALIAQQD